jgi:ABC-type nitrate/sulfonate/bicarbonate transport system permease component
VPIIGISTTWSSGPPGADLRLSIDLGLWTRVFLPSVVPPLFVALRVASALTLIVTLLTDILGAGTGVGRLLVVSQQRFDAAACWGLLLVVGTIGAWPAAVSRMSTPASGGAAAPLI